MHIKGATLHPTIHALGLILMELYHNLNAKIGLS